nr:putative carbohydrate binding domain containing protein [uncultured Mediterranean phage uvMED]
MATINLGRIKPVFRGAYAGGTAYVVDDIVTHGNESFICIQAGTGNATSNASYWTKLAAKGTDGTDVGTTLTTQGDILYRDGSGLQRLAAGTSGHFLKTQGSGANPVWAESGGGILQVKSATKTDTQSFSSGVGAARMDITGLSLSLTPSSASNKVLVWFNCNHWGNDSHCQIERQIASGSYSIISPPTGSYGSRTPTHSGGSHRDIYELNTANMTVLDAPNTTSVCNYKITFNNGPAGGGTGYVNRTSSDSDDGNGERAISTITAMEVASGVL